MKHTRWLPSEDHWRDDDADDHRRRLAGVLRRAAIELRVELVGEPRYGWRDRSVGVRVDDDGRDGWLRLVGEPADGDVGVFWDGNVTASQQLNGLRLPRVWRSWEYAERDLRFRADLMSYVDEPACSPTAALTVVPALTETWWARLAGTLAFLPRVDTDRVAVDAERFASRIGIWDAALPVDVQRWVPAHADLHWAQLTTPGCWVLDWEGWGLAPAGFDAASLYLHSLAAPPVAQLVRARYATELDSHDGMLSQLYIAGRMLDRGDLDDHPAETAVFAHAGTVLRALGADPGSYQHLLRLATR
ncbi:hypothetical protein [Micromonospora sp. WMMD1082]|uniref:hypothetical protein n=1 Tax=Micromonospora sp. WMMD1082 TaxID=3016104 RepID=UPI002416312F|nr:hypothetical protein [Micromonospora sp. WMMD1082]MDG4793078.1 hypothetical protein [Micromonospora sp. WMMD1082]